MLLTFESVDKINFFLHLKSDYRLFHISNDEKRGKIQVVYEQYFSAAILILLFNRPFPSSCLPPLQSESKCEVFVMLISSTLHMNEN